jgi:quercetin dioxygenase-like cupin family protein
VEITKILIDPSYKKDNGIWVLRIDPSLLPKDFYIAEQSLVLIPPHQVGGNHKHPRKEAFLATSKDLVLYWIDGKGKKHEDIMFGEDKLILYIIYPNIPHAVLNKSNSSSALLYEFANEKQHDVEAVKVV